MERNEKTIMSTRGWIGVDFDGTLVEHVLGKWKGIYHVGKPIPKMVERIKKLIEEGIQVRIMTARACDPNPDAVKVVEDWTEEHLGKRLRVTNVKDYHMWLLYDDRARQVRLNEGTVVGEVDEIQQAADIDQTIFHMVQDVGFEAVLQALISTRAGGLTKSELESVLYNYQTKQED